MTIHSIAVFCGARDGNRPAYRQAARALGTALAQRSIRLVYGGGGLGMMGALADAVLDAGGQVTGVIPHGLARREFAHPRVDPMHHVDTMHERKALMERLSGAFIALPGGFGTLDELFEIATWSQLGLHHKPIGLLDTEGYWQGLRAQTERAVADGYVAESHAKLMVVEREPVALLDRLLAHTPPAPVIQWAGRTAPP